MRAFADSKGSGSGDFTGLIGKLDYLQWLGVDCLWLPPFYASPLRDGGYDISDYCAILPEFGTLPEFTELVSQAHQRGIRIVTDLVINHTSDQHPWFQASRSDPEGPYGDFYVWSDDDTAYADARIIFVDTETSNWTFDSVRRQFFWHRFFGHQPDLNFDNPAVVDADAGRRAVLDGPGHRRLPAGRDPLPLRARGHQLREPAGDARLPGPAAQARRRGVPGPDHAGRGQPVAEGRGRATSAPSDEPECHMCFHFPVMPRLYYALREEKATPVVEIMAETPDIPRGGQWGTFLRNHDELTLEMVTTEERAAMYGWFAPDPRMRANIGIRRRLSSLLDNSRAEIELIHALLLSLPGSPCLYYGDEIGMGDNIWLDDRDCGAHADAVDAGPQRGLLHRGPGQALPAGRPVAGLQLQRTPTSRPSWRAAPRCCTGSARCSRSGASTRSSAWASTSRCRSDNDAILAFVRQTAPDDRDDEHRCGDGAVRQQPGPYAAERAADRAASRSPAAARATCSAVRRSPTSPRPGRCC